MPEDNTTPTGEAAGAAQNQQQTTESPKDKTFTQEQINAAVREEKKQWQARMKELESKATQWDKLQEDSKSELEKLTGELGQHKAAAEQARLDIARIKAFAKAGVDPEKIDEILSVVNVAGTTAEEIDANVQKLKALGLLQPKTPGGAQGAGNPGLPPKKEEPNIDQQIKDAEKAGNVALAIQLKLRKQGLG